MLTQTLGKYRIERTIGSGSYGTVVEATDCVLNRPVALKILRSTGMPEELLKNHLREARALARLRHPNIVAIFDLEQDGDRTVLAMEHIDGETLAARLRHGPVPLVNAMEMAWQLADALAAAHQQGVVHADIKPGNVIIDQQARPLLVDFGLARLSCMEDGQDTLASARGSTAGLQGTISYMAPELFMGAKPDTSTDMFAFGALIYEMVSGRRPFDAGSEGATMQRILNSRPERLSLLNPEIPTSLSDLVDSMLATSPTGRPASMDTVRETLGRIAGSAGGALVLPLPRPLPALPASLLAEPDADRPRRQRYRPLMLGLLAGVPLALLLLTWGQDMIPWRIEATLSLQDQISQGVNYLSHLDDKGAIDGAINAFEAVLTRDPRNAAATAGRSLALFRRYTEEEANTKILNQADAEARLALSLDNQLALTRIAMGWAETYANNKEAAYQHFQTALTLEQDNVLTLEGLGLLYQGDERTDEAIAIYKRGIEKHPKYRVFYYQLGRIYFQQAQYSQAEQVFAKCVELAPDSALGYANLSATQHMQGRTEDAVLTIQQGLRIRPHWMLYNNLGTYLYFLGEYPRAAQAFERLTQEDNGNNYLTWGNLGDAYRWSTGQEKEAQSAYRMALRLLDPLLKDEPDNPRRNSKAALYHAKLGDSVEAMAALEHAVAKPTPEILYDAAVTSEIVGRRDQALDLLGQALKAGYAPQEVARDPELAQLRQDQRYSLLLTSL